MSSETISISDALLQQIANALHIDYQNMKFVGYSQNFIYEITDACGERILRVTSAKHRTFAQILAELKWINYLKSRGVNACIAFARKNAEDAIISVETLSDILHCVVFEKAQGKPIETGMLNNELYFMQGALLGKIHRLTRQCPNDLGRDRFYWADNRLFNSDIQEYLPAGMVERIAAITRQLIVETSALPKTEFTFGLVHFDIHYENFFKNGKELWLFDFDNCSNGYYVNDIAKALWSSVFTKYRKSEYRGKSPFSDFALSGQILEKVWHPFWDGYKSENEINELWFDQIPLFFELIHLKEFVHHYRHGVPYRSEELTNIFAMEQEQIEKRMVPVAFNFKTGKALREDC